MIDWVFDSSYLSTSTCSPCASSFPDEDTYFSAVLSFPELNWVSHDMVISCHNSPQPTQAKFSSRDAIEHLRPASKLQSTLWTQLRLIPPFYGYYLPRYLNTSLYSSQPHLKMSSGNPSGPTWITKREGLRPRKPTTPQPASESHPSTPTPSNSNSPRKTRGSLKKASSGPKAPARKPENTKPDAGSDDARPVGCQWYVQFPTLDQE